MVTMVKFLVKSMKKFAKKQLAMMSQLLADLLIC